MIWSSRVVVDGVVDGVDVVVDGDGGIIKWRTTHVKSKWEERCNSYWSSVAKTEI